jgi:DNA (cytosine-5)-methyltransferase 1
MGNKKENIKTKLADFPEEITEEGLKIYGETSYENQMAVLSHFLHNHPKRLNKERKEEIILAVREFLSRKEFRQGFDEDELSDEEVLRAAETPLQYDLFSDFFDVPFPAPKKPKFTFIDLFAGIGGFRIAMQELGGKCVYSSEFDVNAQKTYLANYGEMPFGDITKESTKRYIPKNFNILCAGFPCQAFNIMGKMRVHKKLVA